MSISELQSSFAGFVAAQNGQGDKKATQETFTANLNGYASSPLDIISGNNVLSIHNRWARILQELQYQPERLSLKNLSRMDKITQRLNLLVPDTGLGPVTKTVADDIQDLLLHPHASELLSQLTTGNADKYKKEFPNVVRHAQGMCSRIASGEYGMRLKLQVSNPQKSPLKRVDRFVKMLFVDLIFHRLDPTQECEWFAKCPRREVLEVAKNLHDLRRALMDECYLPKRVVDGSFMAKTFYLSRESSEMYKAIKERMNYAPEQHPYLLEHINQYVLPTTKMLEGFAMLSLLSVRPTSCERSIKILSHLPKESHARVVKLIKMAAKKCSADALLASLAPYKESDKAFYQAALLGVIKGLVKAELTPKAFSLVPQVAEEPLFSDYLPKLIGKVASKSVNQETLVRLLGLILSQKSTIDQVNSLSSFFQRQLATQSNANAFATCDSLLLLFQGHELFPYALRSYAFALFKSSKGETNLPKVFSLYKRISDVGHRHDFLETIVVFCVELGSRKLLEEFVSRLEDRSEKDHFYKNWAREAYNKDYKDAFAIADLIADPRVKLQTNSLLSIKHSGAVASARAAAAMSNVSNLADLLAKLRTQS